MVPLVLIILVNRCISIKYQPSISTAFCTTCCGGVKFNLSEELVITYHQFQCYLCSQIDHFSSNISNTRDKQRISRFIFRTNDASLEKLAMPFRSIVTETKLRNPNDIQVYFSGDDRSYFIDLNFPQYLSCYRLLVPGAFQADLFRLLVLYRYGGVYVDISVRFLKPLDDIIYYANDGFVAVKEIYDYGIQQTFIASYKEHPLVGTMIDRVISMISQRGYGLGAGDITGPKILMLAFNSFFKFPPRRSINGGSYSLNGFKLKFLYHSILHAEEGNFMSLVQGNTKSAELQKKFKGYHELMYGNGLNGTKHYFKHWQERTVYRLDIKNESCPLPLH